MEGASWILFLLAIVGGVAVWGATRQLDKSRDADRVVVFRVSSCYLFMPRTGAWAACALFLERCGSSFWIFQQSITSTMTGCDACGRSMRDAGIADVCSFFAGSTVACSTVFSGPDSTPSSGGVGSSKISIPRGEQLVWPLRPDRSRIAQPSTPTGFGGPCALHPTRFVIHETRHFTAMSARRWSPFFPS
jgi:hypothetical protein